MRGRPPFGAATVKATRTARRGAAAPPRKVVAAGGDAAAPATAGSPPYGKCRIKKALLRGVMNLQSPTRLEIEGETEAGSSLAR